MSARPITSARDWFLGAPVVRDWLSLGCVAAPQLDEKYHVYRISHVESGMGYFGCTSRPDLRLREHFQTCGAPKLHEALRRDGLAAFCFEIVATFATRREAHRHERKLVIECGTTWPNGYNLQKGGDGSLTNNLSPETRQRLSEQARQHHGSPEGKSQLSKAQTNSWTGERGARRRAAQQQRWTEPDFRDRALAGLRRTTETGAFWDSEAGIARRKALGREVAERNRQRAASHRRDAGDL